MTPVGEAVGTFREEGAGSRRPPMALARCAVTKRNLSVVDLSAMARRGPPLRAAVEGAVGGASATPRRSPPRPGTDRERAGNSVRGRGSGGGGGYAAAGRRRKLYLRILLSAQNLVKSQRGAQSGRHVRGANSIATWCGIYQVRTAVFSKTMAWASRVNKGVKRLFSSKYIHDHTAMTWLTNM